MKKIPSLIIACLLSTSLYSADFITFGTGELNGTYYPTGNSMCKFINKITIQTNIRCTIESTDGSVYNINAIESGKFNFAIAQADTIYQAVHGIKKFDKRPNTQLRSVMAIYPEMFTLITRKDASIMKLSDIKGKRVNLGNIKSGSESTRIELFKAFNIKQEDLSLSSALKIEDTEDALIDNEIDAYFFMVGHPAETIQNAAISIPITIVPIVGPKADLFIEENKYFVKDVIPAGLYKGVDKAIETFSVKAVVVTREDVSEKLVYTFVKTILENFEEFKTLHPAYSNVTKESLLEGLSVPLHRSAKKYFKEIGLL